MQGLEVFYIPGCPYCIKAQKALADLTDENPDFMRVPIKWINEQEKADYASKYDYYYVPSIYFGHSKVFEASPGDTYERIKNAMKEALDKALSKEVLSL